MTQVIRKWGNSLGVRIPRTVAFHAGLVEGTRVSVAVQGGAIVLRPADVPPLTELLAQIGPKDRPPIVGWGPPVGREVW